MYPEPDQSVTAAETRIWQTHSSVRRNVNAGNTDVVCSKISHRSYHHPRRKFSIRCCSCRSAMGRRNHLQRKRHRMFSVRRLPQEHLRCVCQNGLMMPRHRLSKAGWRAFSVSSQSVTNSRAVYLRDPALGRNSCIGIS